MENGLEKTVHIANPVLSVISDHGQLTWALQFVCLFNALGLCPTHLITFATSLIKRLKYCDKSRVSLDNTGLQPVVHPWLINFSTILVIVRLN